MFIRIFIISLTNLWEKEKPKNSGNQSRKFIYQKFNTLIKIDFFKNLTNKWYLQLDKIETSPCSLG